ncbi:hypothetical protein [Kosakonia phage Kc304]|nr:hypothetical protein [Kosakonia phage Kc304]
MNSGQHALIKLGEECNEVAQVCSKIIQFGMDSEYNGETNRERLYFELQDVLACIEYLKAHSDFKFKPDEYHIRTKIDKIEHFKVISERLGYVAP